MPNKHFRKLWREFVKVQKKLHALEHYVRLLEKKEPAYSRHDKRVLRRLRRIIRLEEGDAVAQMRQELLDFQQAIEDGRRQEEEYNERFFLSPNGGRRYNKDDKLHKFLRETFADQMKERFGYSYDMRMKFFDHLEDESSLGVSFEKKVDPQEFF